MFWIYLLFFLGILVLVFWPKKEKETTTDKAKNEDYNPEYITEPDEEQQKQEVEASKKNNNN